MFRMACFKIKVRLTGQRSYDFVSLSLWTP
jgi:hypothetical protein